MMCCCCALVQEWQEILARDESMCYVCYVNESYISTQVYMYTSCGFVYVETYVFSNVCLYVSFHFSVNLLLHSVILLFLIAAFKLSPPPTQSMKREEE